MGNPLLNLTKEFDKMAGTIGIKIANGDFYPIITEGESTVKKRLVLTTVHDGQENVQIDLFRSDSKSIQDAQYIGSLVVEEIKPKPKGEPSIEMIISCGTDGTITADACDLDAGDGERNTLSVSLQTMENRQKSSDFHLENKPQTSTNLYEETESTEEKRKTPWLIIIFAVIFMIIVLALLWLFLLGGRDTQMVRDAEQYFRGNFGSEQALPPPPPPPPPEPPPPPPPPPPPEPAPGVEEVPVIQAPVAPPPERSQVVERKRPPAPVSSYKVPAVIPKNGVAYQIRWGDTLWDISEAFYRNPWLYPRIARHNNIRNPDHIIAGRTIRIPPKN
jgi:outer membrane biosynthesis protein TonB